MGHSQFLCYSRHQRQSKQRQNAGMATFTNRGTSVQVKIRLGKYKHSPITFSAKTMGAARKKAEDIERQIRDGSYVDLKQFESENVSDLITRYITDVLIQKSPRTQEIEGIRLNILKCDLEHVSLSRADDQYFFDYFRSLFERVTKQTRNKQIDEQKTWSPTYVKKYTQDMINVFTAAKVVWKMTLPFENPAREARDRMSHLGLFIEADLERELRLTTEQYNKIRHFRDTRNIVLKYFALFLIETGMRRGEALSIKEHLIHWEACFYELETQKTDRKRTRQRRGRDVPLTPRAMAILRLVIWLKKSIRVYDGKRNDAEVWPWRGENAGNTVYHGIKRIYKKLGMENITVHDLRHEFGSHHIDNGLDIRLVASAMGQQDLKSTKRYTHPNATRLSKALSRRKK